MRLYDIELTKEGEIIYNTLLRMLYAQRATSTPEEALSGGTWADPSDPLPIAGTYEALTAEDFSILTVSDPL